ncbi:MAG TPA: PKD domain-containing protein [Methanoregulaceae archaeon]|nr:PKD domain-containing protein [Methanoregulaceae archaeon]
MNMKGVMCTVILLLAATLLVLPVSGAFTVTGIDPDRGNNTGWVYVDVTGNELPEAFSVILTNGPAGTSNITGQYNHFYNAGWISCFFDLNGEEAGARTVVVVNTSDGSEAILEGTPFLVENLPPTVSSVNPISGINTQDSVDLTVKGSDFRDGDLKVTLTKEGTTPISAEGVSWVSSGEITCKVNISGAAAGKWSVEVTNPDGKTGVLKEGFTVWNPAPIITEITPSTGSNDNPKLEFTITESGVLTGAVVSLNKTGEKDIVAFNESGFSINYYFNLSGAKVGAWDVVVTNTDGQSGTLPNGFFITYPNAPTVTAVEPSKAVNSGIVTITNLSGTGFEEGATVNFSKGLATIAAENIVVNSLVNITCSVNLTGAEIGQWNITVTNDDGQSGTLDNAFEVVYPAPEIGGISPPSGANNAVVNVTISGAFFKDTPAVNLTKEGSTTISGTNVTIVNAGTIKCDLPLAGAALGNWSVTVRNPDGQVSNSLNFTVENPRPTVSGVTPSKGTNDTVVAVTVSGAYLLDSPKVPRVNLTTPTGTDVIQGEKVTVLDPGNITCEFNLTGRALGQWNLIVVNPDGKAGGIRNAFRITTPPPVPDFTASPTYGTVPLTVQFTDLSTNYPYIWSWNFGDGSIVTGINQANPVHVYNTPGVYNVTLYALNSDGVGEKITKSSYITVVETPVAHFTATPMSGPAPLFVQFTDTSDGNPYRWAWKFGDGQISDQKNPYFLYKNPGLYQVELTVYNKAGSDTATKTIEVLVSPPDAEFTANRTAGDSPLTVSFTDLSTGAPTNWSWKFGDSGNSTEQNPVYVFSSPGTYGVQLTASNAAGTSTETKNGYIVVGQTIKADFNLTPSNEGQTAPLSVAFSDLSSGNILKWNWNFGDAHISTERNPIHTYPSPGTYTITLSVLGLTGSDSVTKTITVVAPLIADFIAEPTTGSAPLTIMLSDRSTGDVATREWVIMDNPEEYAKNIVYFSEGQGDQMYTLTEPGLYTVRLTIRDADGKPDSEIKTNYINVLPFP